MGVASTYLDERRSYLFPAIHIKGHTCPTCRGAKLPEYRLCYQCKYACTESNPDSIGFGMFARAGEQSSTNMSRYKSAGNVDGSRNVAALLTGAIFQAIQHPAVTFDLITTAPSMSGRAGEHPLYALTRKTARSQGVGDKVAPLLTVVPGATKDRTVQRRAFQAERSEISGKRILLIDDTWTSGGTIRSAVLALRQAGAKEVNAVALARWIQAGNEAGEDELWRLAEKYRPNFSSYNFFDGI